MKPKATKATPAPTTLRLDVSPDMPLGEAKDLLIRSMRRKGGCFCPLCGQQSTIYQRNINASIVTVMRALALWHQEFGDKYAPMAQYIFKNEKYGVKGTGVSDGGQWAQAVFWGLVERERGKVHENGSNRTGLARITSKGLSFLAGKCRIQKYAFVFNNTLLGKGGGLVTIADVEKLTFDYREIFAGRESDPEIHDFPDEELYVNKDHFIDVSNLVYESGPPPPGTVLSGDDAEEEFEG